MKEEAPSQNNWRSKIFKIIYHADTPAGKWFDIMLIVFILISVLTIILDSVEKLHIDHGEFFYILEWFFTVVFTLEYFLRLICIRKPIKYVFSFFGIVDILSILRTYLSIFIVGAQSLLVIRILSVLRIFRIL